MDLPEMYWSASRGVLITRLTEGVGAGRLLISAYTSGHYLNVPPPADTARLCVVPSDAAITRAVTAARAEFWNAPPGAAQDKMLAAFAEAAIRTALGRA